MTKNQQDAGSISIAPTLREAAASALDALCLPCGRWNGTQSRIVNAAIDDLRSALAAQPAPDAITSPRICRVIAKGGRFSRGLYENPSADHLLAWEFDGDTVRWLVPIAQQEAPSGYESITSCYTRWVSPEKFAKLTAKAQKWYRPYWVNQQAAPAQMPDLSALTKRGAVAWAGVDAQELREGGQAAPAQPPFAPDWAGYRQGVSDGAAQARLPLTDEQIQSLWVSGAVGPARVGVEPT